MASNSNTSINNTSALINNTSAPHNNTTNNNTYDNTPNINNKPLSDNTTSNTNLLPDNTSNNNLPPSYPAVLIDNNQYISNTPRQSFNIVDDYDSDSSNDFDNGGPNYNSAEEIMNSEIAGRPAAKTARQSSPELEPEPDPVPVY
ncbi:hypothetical protein F8M41_025358 [Gigaspora margarita]|uniref:Uncharacterized protein n=1 Tax=Gigaspora margarita TaxID=4874 RepID=A0A8H3XIT9_GIGMA|nr:hypothetical protein F8M41_025358 [Gigaspora margarita]